MDQLSTLSQVHIPGSTSGKLESELLPHMKMLGRQHGLKNKPATETEFKVRALKHIANEVQHAIEENYATYMPASMGERIRHIEDEKNMQVGKLQAEHDEVEEKHGRLSRMLLHLTMPSEKRWMGKLNWAIKISIALAETIMSYPAIRNMGFSVINAACASVGVGVLAGATVHVGSRYIKESSTRLKRYLKFSAIMGVAAIVFTGLGFARAKAFNQLYDLNPISSLAGLPQIPVPAWLFILMSVGFFCGALFVGVCTCKTKAEEKADTAYLELKDMVQDAAKGMQAKKDAIMEVVHAANTADAKVRADHDTGASIERHIIVVGHKAEDAYVQSNIPHRPDGKFPDFFAEPVQFNFRTYFNHQTNKTIQ